MGTRSSQRGPAGGGCARIELVRRAFWCAVWVWFGVRTLRAANRIARCQRVSRLGVYAARLWAGARRVERDDLVYNETLGDWRTHNGVDYACKAGEDVLAPVSGTVESLAAEGNWGVVAAIRDGEGRLWRLSALEDAAVRQGDAVTAGQKLGQAGAITGESAQDPHIHLEVLDGDKYLDPVKLIGS